MRGPLLLLLLVLAGCRLAHPSVDEVLRPADGPKPEPTWEDARGDDLARLGEELVPELDRIAADARAAAGAAPRDADAQTAASIALFQATDLRILLAAIRCATAGDAATGEALLAQEDRFEPALAGEVVALGLEGRDLARRALELDPESVAAHHYVALHGVMIAQAEGSSAGAAFRIGGVIRAMEATIALDPEYDGAAPLLVLGRFRDRAPWPHQDRDEAVELLERAAAICPSPSRLLFLGDALFGQGDRFEDAIRTWERAATAPDSPHDLLAPFYRERARARLERERSWLEGG